MGAAPLGSSISRQGRLQERRHDERAMIPLLLLTVVTCSEVPASEAQFLIRRHEDGLRRIHAIRATIEAQLSDDGGRSWSPMFSVSIRRSGQRERIHEAFYRTSLAGRWQSR